MKKLLALTLIFFSSFGLSAQNQNGLYNKPQGVKQMQDVISETIPNAQFPFGEPLRILRQQDRTPKKVFVLGVYASAVHVHARWHSPDGKIIGEALAVASEPEIFWNGENAAEIISRITVPSEVGYLNAAEDKYNGASGRALDELYLAPMGFSRSNAWLCDLVPHSFMNENQEKAIRTRYASLCEKYNLPTASIPEKPVNLIDDNRRNEILAELEESQAETIILLGDDLIKWFLSLVSNCKKTRLAEFGRNTYGSPVSVNINGKIYRVLPLVHMRHSGAIGTHDDGWKQLHNNWVENMNRQK